MARLEEDEMSAHRCRSCRCTDENACKHPTGLRCAWAEAELCTACVPGADPDWEHPEIPLAQIANEKDEAISVALWAIAELRRLPRWRWLRGRWLGEVLVEKEAEIETFNEELEGSGF